MNVFRDARQVNSSARLIMPLLGVALTVALLVTLLGALNGAAFAAEEAPAAADPAALVINEFMADNKTAWIDPDDPGLDEYPDWFEIYNPGAQAVSLDGLFVSDDPTLPAKFAITDGLTIDAGAYAIFYADDEEETEGPYHVGFKLDKKAGFIGLFMGDQGQTEISSVIYDQEQQADVSSGRLPDGTGDWRLFNRPSPGRSNNVTSPLISSVERDPDLPAASQPVTVRATITDDIGVVTATLVYTVAGGANEVAMNAAGQDQFEGQIPGLPDATLVEYTVRAMDGDGQVTPDLSFELRRTYRYVVGYEIPPLAINEIIADNYLALEDPDDPGDYPDWFELHNTSDQPVSLDGLYLTDDLDISTMFAITDGLSIPARGFVVFYADKDPEQGPFHTNFKLNFSGELVALTGAQGTVQIDIVRWGRAGDPVGNLLTNQSYGRHPDGTGEWQYLFCTTPGEENMLCDNRIFVPIAAR